jgi:hypothetical protein
LKQLGHFNKDTNERIELWSADRWWLSVYLGLLLSHVCKIPFKKQFVWIYNRTFAGLNFMKMKIPWLSKRNSELWMKVTWKTLDIWGCIDIFISCIWPAVVENGISRS